MPTCHSGFMGFCPKTSTRDQKPYNPWLAIGRVLFFRKLHCQHEELLWVHCRCHLEIWWVWKGLQHVYFNSTCLAHSSTASINEYEKVVVFQFKTPKITSIKAFSWIVRRWGAGLCIMLGTGYIWKFWMCLSLGELWKSAEMRNGTDSREGETLLHDSADVAGHLHLHQKLHT